MYNKGDKYIEKQTGEIWTVYAYRPDSNTVCLEQMSNTQLLHSKWINELDLFALYTKVDENQLDWLTKDWNLPEGSKEEASKPYCFHVWKEYTGLNFSDEYCEKCNIKRPLEKK